MFWEYLCGMKMINVKISDTSECPKDKGSTGKGISKDGVSVIPSAVQNHQTG